VKSWTGGKASQFVKKKREYNESSIDSNSSSSSDSNEASPVKKAVAHESNSSIKSDSDDLNSEERKVNDEERSIYSEIVRMTKSEGRKDQNRKEDF
jgi:hypothetical protein